MNSWMHKCVVSVVILLCYGWTGIAEVQQNRLEVYDVERDNLDAMEQVVNSIVGDAGNIIVDGKHSRLLVVATDEQHRQIAGLVKKVNIPTRNVRIDVRFKKDKTSQLSEAGVKTSGGMIINNSGTDTRITLQPKIIHQTVTTSSDTIQMLMVASGHSASLHIGEEVPYMEWIMDYGYHWGLIEQRINWQQVGSRLVVEPTIIGNGPMIQVRVTPELSGLVDGNPYHLKFERVSTEVTVQDGQTVNIGGQRDHHDFYSKFLVGMQRNGGIQDLLITLTPHIE